MVTRHTNDVPDVMPTDVVSVDSVRIQRDHNYDRIRNALQSGQKKNNVRK